MSFQKRRMDINMLPDERRGCTTVRPKKHRTVDIHVHTVRAKQNLCTNLFVSLEVLLADDARLVGVAAFV